jgi:asparagine synthase (glutamine-hydrolysing)
MCGIAGAVFWGDVPGRIDPLRLVGEMTRALAHRGPDGEAVVECTPRRDSGTGATCVLGHRRLAILDLSERAAQPMTSPRVPVCATYNGEIYNFRALRRDLERLGRQFQSESDTEVLLQGYEAWGPSVLDRLRGMFAFAIWDGRTQRLLVARDRLGIKPLYLHRTERGMLFASEIRALLASGLVPRELDAIALDQFLAYQAVPPPRTLIRGIDLLRPGHVAVIDQRKELTSEPYWDLLACADPARRRRVSFTTARDRVRELLCDAIDLHLVSDVPVGVFLSGGVDSSALVALMHGRGITARTFSVGFPGTSYDESAYARAVAATFGTEHTEIAVHETEIPDQIKEAVASIDHPSGDGINTFLISRAVRAAGLKVTLSGLGGDEFFGGYPSFERFARYGHYARAWGRSPEAVRSGLAAAMRAVGQQSVATEKTAALLESDGTLPEMFPIMRQLFSASQREALLGHQRRLQAEQEGDPYVTLLARAVAHSADASLMALVSYAEARTYMHDVLLRDTDQMSMRWGLEVRVPLIDHQLVEYLMSLPEDLRKPGDRPKRLLIESLPSPLPRMSVDRPKQGFVLPFPTWMRGELRPFCEHHLHDLAARGFLSDTAVQSIWRAFLSGDRRVSWSRPWTLVALNAWLDRTGITA